jgi:hypothetical protein
VGLLIAFAGALRKSSHSPLAFSASIGAIIAVYNTTQTDFVGVFAHSYGYKWWLFGLAALAVSQKALELVMLAVPGAAAQKADATSRGVTQS